MQSSQVQSQSWCFEMGSSVKMVGKVFDPSGSLGCWKVVSTDPSAFLVYVGFTVQMASFRPW